MEGGLRRAHDAGGSKQFGYCTLCQNQKHMNNCLSSWNRKACKVVTMLPKMSIRFRLSAYAADMLLMVISQALQTCRVGAERAEEPSERGTSVESAHVLQKPSPPS